MRPLLALCLLSLNGCQLHELLWPDPAPPPEKCYAIIRSWTPNVGDTDTTYHRYEVQCPAP